MMTYDIFKQSACYISDIYIIFMCGARNASDNLLWAPTKPTHKLNTGRLAGRPKGQKQPNCFLEA